MTISTSDAIDLVTDERRHQKDSGMDGLLTDRNDLIATTVAYLGRASQGVRRNEKDGLDAKEMLVKAAAVIVAAIEREA